jgi:hypothetical protein
VSRRGRLSDDSGTLPRPEPDIKATDEDVPVIAPPSSAQVDMERRPILYLPDGRILVRAIGFRTEGK